MCSHAKEVLLMKFELTWLSVIYNTYKILLDFSLTVKAAPHECVIKTSQA